LAENHGKSRSAIRIFAAGMQVPQARLFLSGPQPRKPRPLQAIVLDDVFNDYQTGQAMEPG
jgi:hypothetical protein